MKINTKRLAVSAMMIALSVVLEFICSLIPFLHLPFGGGFTVASMLPIIYIAYAFGVKWGALCSFVYSIAELAMGHSTVVGLFTPASDTFQGISAAICICFLDYIVAYTVLCLGGVFGAKKKTTGRLVGGVAFAIGLRYLVHIISGAIFYGTWAEWFFSQESFPFGQAILNNFSGASLAVIYSIIYNGLYMIPEIIVTCIIAALINRRVYPLFAKISEN